MWNKLNAKSVVLLQEYMYKDVYATHQLCVINDAQLVTENVVNDISFASSHAAYQAHADPVLWRYEIFSDILAVTFLIKYCGLLDSDLDY